MSQLDRWNKIVQLYPEIVKTDKDGNTRTCASDTPIALKVWLAPVGQSGTAARRSEQDNEGYESEKLMRMRMIRSNHHITIGAQARIGIDGNFWSVFGDKTEYMATSRTAHQEYTLRRA